MASAPPSSDDRQQQAALALLLLAAKRRYSLPDLVRQHRVRIRPFRQIRPTIALKSDLASPYFDVTRSWSSEVDALLAAYERGGAGAVQQQLGISRTKLNALVAVAKQRFPGIVSRFERWHRWQWLSRVKASTGLDVSLLTQPGDVTDPMRATASWNGALLDDVHRQTAGRVATALLGGAAASLPASDVRAQVLDAIAKARKRSAAIGDDQIDKLSRAMDRARREAAGVTTFRWIHVPQRHPRDWHLARHGKVFDENDIQPNDRAGVPPFCKCSEVPVLI